MPPDDDLQSVQRLSEAYRRITSELGKVIVGQQHVIEELMIAMFARGHCLLVGVPGLAKTLMIRTLADSLNLETIIARQAGRGLEGRIDQGRRHLRRQWRPRSGR